MTPPKTNKERQRAYYQRMKAAGMKKVCDYVPANMVAALHKYAERLRQDVKLTNNDPTV